MSEPVPATDPALGTRAYELDRAHVFHSWSAQGALAPMTFAGGSGSYVWDYEGTRYLDFSSQLVNTNIGHQHPKVIAAIQEHTKIKPGETTSDNKVSLLTARCIGACGIAPAVVYDGTVTPRATPESALEHIKKWR